MWRCDVKKFRRHSFVIGAYVLVLSFTLPFGLIACSRDQTATTAPQTEQPAVPPEYAEMQAQAELAQQWIQRMDPYVSQNPDGTYVMDWDGFRATLARSDPRLALSLQNGATATVDTKMIIGLRNGISAANKAVLADEAQGMQPAARWCTNHWWGRKCCYTGWDAELAIWYGWAVAAVATVIGVVPGAIMAYIAWMQERLNSQCGGFCVNVLWGSPFVWLTCP